MNSKLLLLAISVAAFSSCTTLYKSGQTPDDVYYSPVRTYGEDSRKEETRKEEKRDDVRNYNYEDRTIRFGINDRRWRNFDNDYAYNPYNYGYNSGYYYNPYYWSYPVYGGYVFTTPVNPKITTPRKANLGGYSPNYNNTSVNTKTGSVRPPSRQYNNSNRGSAVGNVIRQIIAPSNNGNNNSYNNSNNNNSNNSSNNSRTYTPSNSSSSSSSSSGSSSSGSVSRPPRGGGN